MRRWQYFHGVKIKTGLQLLLYILLEWIFCFLQWLQIASEIEFILFARKSSIFYLPLCSVSRIEVGNSHVLWGIFFAVLLSKLVSEHDHRFEDKFLKGRECCWQSIRAPDLVNLSVPKRSEKIRFAPWYLRPYLFQTSTSMPNFACQFEGMCLFEIDSGPWLDISPPP